MFEAAEIDHQLDKETYEALEPELREHLLDAQFEFQERGNASVVVLVAGVDGAGKGDTVNLLNTWLDPRHVQTHGMGRPTSEEEERPYLWRFWRRLPRKGRLGIFFGSWYTQPILRRAYGEIDDSELAQAMERVRRFEQMLTDEGIILVKLWFHLSKKQQRKRLKRLEKNKRTRWRVTEKDWRHHELYDDFVRISSRALRATSTDNAPWRIISGNEPKYRQITVAQFLRDALRSNAAVPETPPETVLRPQPPVDGRLLVRNLDLGQTLARKPYKRELLDEQGRLSLLTRDDRFANRSLVIVMEGSDAAGKGGAIRRVTAALDARDYQVVPIAAPTDEEKAHPYLWRFWRHAPHHRKVVIFDRSWYGRVLVERVEGFAQPADWSRGYSEINEFEEQLAEKGTVVVKFWLQIDKEEQLARFEARKQTAFKRHKITDEDWRNRERWEDYELAVEDMVQRTSTDIAPWTLVEANDKYFARIKILRTICDRLEAVL